MDAHTSTNLQVSLLKRSEPFFISKLFLFLKLV